MGLAPLSPTTTTNILNLCTEKDEEVSNVKLDERIKCYKELQIRSFAENAICTPPDVSLSPQSVIFV